MTRRPAEEARRPVGRRPAAASPRHAIRGTPGAAPAERSRSWLAIGLVVALALVALVVVGMLRYAPLLDQTRAARASAGRLAAQVRQLGPDDLEAGRLAVLRGDLADLDRRIAPLRDLVRSDPLVGLVRDLPVVGDQVLAVGALMEAVDAIMEAADLGLGLADEVAAIRSADAADAHEPLLPRMVELMATSTYEVDRIDELLGLAASRIDAIPPTAVGEVREAAAMMREPLERYAPLLDTYREVDDVVPGLLGRGETKRYLVLAQNPAELRPQGGYSGTVGVIAFRDGAIVEQSFIDVHKLDGQEGLPFVEPPAPLRDHLLGEDQSWRLADAAWAADFPTAAREALRFYELETGDGDLDGVIALTTFALDRLLEIVGPVRVDDYDVTVEPGQATLTLLGETRGGERTPDNRKEILDALARTMTSRLLSLPPQGWPGMLEAMVDIGGQRMALAWFADEAAQGLAERSGWAGAVRQDAGDYLYVVEANMAPTSKYNLVVDRAASLVVSLDDEGDALTSLRLDWANGAGQPGEPYRSLRRFSNNTDGWYGTYVRVLVPEGSELVTASGQASDAIRSAEALEVESGRAAFGNYLLIPPGEATLSYLWTNPGAASVSDGTWEYRLLVQKQPGARPDPLSVRLDLPDGASIVQTTDGATVSGGRVRLETTLSEDVELAVRYTLTGD